MKLSILGARVIDPSSGLDQTTDLHLHAGKIIAMGAAPADFSPSQTLDAQGLVAAPGLVDLSVALREPGYSRKGTIASETRAAAAGGVTSLCCPPRTKPVLDTSAVAELILDRAREAGNCKVFPIGALSKGLEGEQLAELIALRDAGCVAFGNGRCVQHRFGLRWAAQASDTACSGGTGFAGDAAFAAVARFAQGDVQVHQPRRGHQAFGVDGLGRAETAGCGADGNDLAGFQVQIRNLIQAAGRIDDSGAENAELHWAFSCSN